MPKENNGPPAHVADHLIDAHTRNGTLDKVLDSGIGGTIEEQLLPPEVAFLSGYTPTYGYELWSYEGGTTVTLVADINSGSGGSYAGFYSGFTEFGGDLYFTAYDPVNGLELRKLGTDGTMSVIDINGGSAGSNAGASGGFTELGGDLYFGADDPVNGIELRKLDGGTGTVETFDFVSGPGSGYGQVLGVVDGTLAIGSHFDRDGDGPAGLSWTMLASAGEPTSVADFQMVDDELRCELR